MSAASLTDFIVKVGVEPAVITALLYLLFRLITDGHKESVEMRCALQSNTDALATLTEFVRGERRG